MLHFLLCFCVAAQSVTQASGVADFNDLNGKISINNASRTQLGGGSAGDAHRRSAGVNYSLKQKKFKCDINASYSGSDALKKSDTFTERIYYDGITSFQGNGGGRLTVIGIRPEPTL